MPLYGIYIRQYLTDFDDIFSEHAPLGVLSIPPGPMVMPVILAPNSNIPHKPATQPETPNRDLLGRVCEIQKNGFVPLCASQRAFERYDQHLNYRKLYPYGPSICGTETKSGPDWSPLEWIILLAPGPAGLHLVI